MQIIFPLPNSGSAAAREQARLDALARYKVLDTAAEESLDRLTRLVKTIFSVSISTVTFLDGHRQWFKSKQGMTVCETGREPAFCNLTIQHPASLIIQDAASDERFADNPFVIGPPHVRFYAGFPLRSPDGHAIGTLCAIDPQPRRFSQQDDEMLSLLGSLAMDLLELRKRALTNETAFDAGNVSFPSPAEDFIRGRSVLKAGRVVFNNSRTTISCTVRQLSPESAVIHVLSTAKIPDRLVLLIDTDVTSRLCTVTARADQHLALSFES
ncbi:GAF domain-containing protein [Bosea lupini]|uniref:GAF domain-containing protein n=1 Tax=Bosea lupini TaxID=1036779 RepID=A0A1H7YLY6_9HYPH|nr:GAF domain-containing protein [Bosea lupini]SEM47246.1 GAF domain-containing protein [Bosea lupini]